MRRRAGLLWTTITMLCLIPACDESGTPPARELGEDEERIGELSMNLIGVDSDRRQYRLRDATFEIQGYAYYTQQDGGAGNGSYSTSVSTETDPGAADITLRLVEGTYYVQLAGTPWYIERLEEGIWTRVEKVVLLSSPYQYAYVYSGGNTSVAYRFGVDGDLIDFRGGNLRIGIEIEQPHDGSDGGFVSDDGSVQPETDGGIGF